MTHSIRPMRLFLLRGCWSVLQQGWRIPFSSCSDGTRWRASGKGRWPNFRWGTLRCRGLGRYRFSCRLDSDTGKIGLWSWRETILLHFHCRGSWHTRWFREDRWRTWCNVPWSLWCSCWLTPRCAFPSPARPWAVSCQFAWCSSRPYLRRVRFPLLLAYAGAEVTHLCTSQWSGIRGWALPTLACWGSIRVICHCIDLNADCGPLKGFCIAGWTSRSFHRQIFNSLWFGSWTWQWACRYKRVRSREWC